MSTWYNVGVEAAASVAGAMRGPLVGPPAIGQSKKSGVAGHADGSAGTRGVGVAVAVLATSAGHQNPGMGSVPMVSCDIGGMGSTSGNWVPATTGDTGGSAASIPVIATTSGSAVASAVSAVTVPLASSASDSVGELSIAPSELLSIFSWRGLFRGLIPFIMMFSLKTDGGSMGVMGCGAIVRAAAPLDAAPGVSACTAPWPRDRPREEGRSPRLVLRPRGLRDLGGGRRQRLRWVEQPVSLRRSAAPNAVAPCTGILVLTFAAAPVVQCDVHMVPPSVLGAPVLRWLPSASSPCCASAGD